MHDYGGKETETKWGKKEYITKGKSFNKCHIPLL